MFLSAHMGKTVYGFSMSETGRNTALEVVISGLMHLMNGLGPGPHRIKQEKAVDVSIGKRQARS